MLMLWLHTMLSPRSAVAHKIKSSARWLDHRLYITQGSCTCTSHKDQKDCAVMPDSSGVQNSLQDFLGSQSMSQGGGNMRAGHLLK